jgi:5-(carboxyamino)imidazole ribonucleotide mutase
MGSDSDLNIMEAAAHMLNEFDIAFELTVVSAHRTPLRMVEYATKASERGLKVIIAGARWRCAFAGHGCFNYFSACYWRSI